MCIRDSITGEGRGFCAGNDLRYQAEGGARPPMPKGFNGLTSRFDLTKPVLAAVNGVAMGGGFETALACDLIIASEQATFALPEPKVGLAALAGGLNRLPRQIGAKRALGMILTGRHVSAKEGFELGFVNEVTAHDKLMERTLAWAHQILECSPLSIRAVKPHGEDVILLFELAEFGRHGCLLGEGGAGSMPVLWVMLGSGSNMVESCCSTVAPHHNPETLHDRTSHRPAHP